MWCSTPWRTKTRAAAAVWLLVLWLGCAQAWAQHPQLAGSRLQGEATLRYFGLRIYHARLWVLPDFRETQVNVQPLVIELEYLRDLNGRAIAERSLQEMRRGAAISDSLSERWLNQMQSMFPDVKAGDRIAGLYQPEQGARFWHNGQPIGQVNDAYFARLFFGIWLAPTTSEPEMRTQLLGVP